MKKSRDVCILDDTREKCIKCKECEICDLDVEKQCNNCMECIFSQESRYVNIDEIRKNIYKPDN